MGCRWAATDAKELYAIWFEVTTCSCWQSVDWCCCNHEYQGSPHLPSISCHTHQCVYTFLDWSNVLQSVVHICITGIVSFSTMQPVSAFLFFYLATDGAASVNVSFQVIAKNHLIWFCKLFTNIRGLLFPAQLILRCAGSGRNDTPVGVAHLVYWSRCRRLNSFPLRLGGCLAAATDLQGTCNFRRRGL